MIPRMSMGSLLLAWWDAITDAKRRAKATSTDVAPVSKLDIEQRLALYVLRQKRTLVVPDLIALIAKKLPKPGNATAHEVQRVSIGKAIVSMLTDSAKLHNQAGFYAFWKAIELMSLFGLISETQIEALAERGMEGLRNA